MKLVKGFTYFFVALVISVASYPLALYSAELGIPYFFIIWYYPGKIMASILTQLLPNSWLFGNPNSDLYWPQASTAGLSILCAILFWSVTLFLLWKICFENKKHPHT